MHAIRTHTTTATMMTIGMMTGRALRAASGLGDG